MYFHRQYGDFMATNIEKRFFEPDFEEKYLNVYELRGWPSLMEGKVNRCCDDYGCLLPLEKIPADAFVDKSALKSITDSERYDLAPTWENYYRLTDSGKGLGLTRSPYNYDRMTLLYVMDKGYPRDGLIDEYPDNFSFYDKFEKIENKLLGRNRWDVYDVMQEKAKKLAGKLLKEHFSEIRRKTDVKEKEHVKKIRLLLPQNKKKSPVICIQTVTGFPLPFFITLYLYTLIFFSFVNDILAEISSHNRYNYGMKIWKE